jgi:hypothetical protein
MILREEHRLKVFENRVFRRIFGPKSDKVTGGWRKLHNCMFGSSKLAGGNQINVETELEVCEC